MEGMGLEKLKEDYEKIRQKYKLPSFRELNEDFNIEKIANTEVEILLREVRKYVGDKLANYMRFVENLINPQNTSMFIFSIIKLLDTEDKNRLSEIYKELMKNEIKFIQTDIVFDEEKEVGFIIESFKYWQTIKEDTNRILEKINTKWDSKSENNSKGYFG